VRDRAPLEALVEEVVDDNPELAAEGLVELAQSYWVDWEMRRSAECARRAIALAGAHGNHRVYARAATTLSVPQWSEYNLAGSLETLQAGIAHARAAGDDAALVGGPLFRAPLVLTWMGRFDEAERLAREGIEVAERSHYALEEGLPLAALAQMSVARGQFADTEQHAHQALLVQRLSGYHWAAGLFLPALASAHMARGRYDAARDALDTWAETGEQMERATVELFHRLVSTRERGQAVQGDPLPGLPRRPIIGADAWAAACVEIARWEGPTADVSGARDLLIAIDELGGVFTSSLVALVPRVLGVAQALTGDDDGAVESLQRAIEVADRLGADAEGAKARVDLATVLARRGDRRESLALVDQALTTLDRLGMTPDAQMATTLAGSGAPGSPAGRTSAPVTNAKAVVFFSDVVDSTRLTEELGVVGYRMRARQVEALVTSAIVAHGGTVVSGISLGDGFIGLFSAIGPALAAARECARDVGSTGLHLHLAVHSGDILIDGNRIYGGPVNYAARMCGLSGPDEILVSGVVREGAAKIPDAAFVDRGQYAFKGFEGPQAVYAMVEPPTDEHRQDTATSNTDLG
jgi:class 3 adenylate cyclase